MYGCISQVPAMHNDALSWSLEEIFLRNLFMFFFFFLYYVDFEQCFVWISSASKMKGVKYVQERIKSVLMSMLKQETHIHKCWMKIGLVLWFYLLWRRILFIYYMHEYDLFTYRRVKENTGLSTSKQQQFIIQLYILFHLFFLYLGKLNFTFPKQKPCMLTVIYRKHTLKYNLLILLYWM